MNGTKNDIIIPENNDEVSLKITKNNLFKKVNFEAKGAENAEKDIPADEKSKDDAEPVSFFKLYSFATKTDLLMIFIGICGAIVTGLSTPANMIIFGDLLDAMVKIGQQAASANGTVDADWFMEEIASFAIWNSILGVILLVFTYLAIMLFNYAAHNQIYAMRGAFLKSVLNQDIGWFDVTQSGEFASRMNEDLSKLEEGLGEKVVMYTHFVVAFIGSMGLAFYKGWLLALVCLSSLPVTLIAVGLVAVITGKLAKKEMDAYGKAGGIAEEVFGAIRTVIAFGGAEKESKRYKENLIDAKNINIKKGFFSGLGFGLLWFFIYASYALAFWYGVTLVLQERDLPIDEIVYTPGNMFTVFFSVMMGSMSLGVSSPFIETFGIAKGAAAKIFQIIERKPEIDPLSFRGIKPSFAHGNITFKNVYFQYPSRPDVKVLEGLSLTIKRGETVAFVGSSGCGKSTCVQLIQRFYDPVSGTILLDDNNLYDLNVNWLRARIGVVGQEPVLFATTIYENIRYGNEYATKEQIEEAAKMANAHDFILKLPSGYNTSVGERGCQISGGQKQRIAIARALVRNPEILLLDESTSALDTASEAKVQSALEKASKGRTTIIIAHRLSTIRNADKICVISDGRLVEQGNHKSLMLNQGPYFKLVTTQIGTDDEVHTEKEFDMKSIVDAYDEDDIPIITAEDSEEEIEAEKTVSLSVFEIMKWNATEWKYILIGSIASIVYGAAMPMFALIFGELTNVLSLPDVKDVRSETDRYSLYFIIAGIVVGISMFFQIYMYGIAGEILTERLRGRAFMCMLKQEIGWFDDKNHGTGTLCAKLSADASAVQGATGQRVGTILSSASTILIAIGISFAYEWRLAFLALAFTPFILIAAYMEIKSIAQENLGNSKTMEQCTKLSVEVVSNVRTVVSIGREQMFHKKYMELLAPSVHNAKKNTHYRGIVYGIARSLMFFAYAACMYYGGYLVIHEGITVGNIFVVSQALIMGSIGIANSLAYAPNFQKGLISAGKMNQLFNRKPKIHDPVSLDGIQPKWEAYGDVSYYKTEFFYPSRPSVMVLQDLTFAISQGQTIALVGSSGCGKSTCINFLERYYDCTSGHVAIDSKDVTQITLKNLRSQMGIVSQEPSLFDRTIAENIAYGDNSIDIPMNQIIAAAKLANIHSFIASLPLGYETRLGNKGTQISGGQKQRIAIARALIRNPRILLLDEATSALDSESEKVVQEALDAAKEGRTCITIAHRLTTIIDADVIFVIDSGKIAEKGNHKELMELKGIYYDMNRAQGGSR